MKKKLLYGLCSLLIVACLGACGKEEDATYGGYTSDDFKAEAEYFIEALNASSYDDIAGAATNARQQGAEAYAVAFEDYLAVIGDIGEFQGMGDFELVKSGKTLTATLTADYSVRDIRLIYVYKANHIDDGPTAINIEPVYSMGEIMEKAALNTVMGIGIVFIMLIAMSLIISLFKYVNEFEKKLQAKESGETVASPAAAAPVAVATAGTDDLELVAVIAAAIAASTGASTDSFVVRSIKKRH